MGQRLRLRKRVSAEKETGARQAAEKDRASEGLREDLKGAQAQVIALAGERDALRKALDGQNAMISELQAVGKELREALARQGEDLQAVLQDLRLLDAGRQEGDASPERRA